MNEAETFKAALRREKANDELEQAFRQGYLAGQRKEHTMILLKLTGGVLVALYIWYILLLYKNNRHKL